MLYQNRTKSDTWTIVWNALVNPMHAQIPKVLGAEKGIAVKFGYTTNIYHEVALIPGDDPYIVVLMTGIDGLNREFTAFDGLIKAIDNLMCLL